MKAPPLIGFLGIAVVLLLTGSASADPLGDALATYQAGNFDAAKAMLTPLAEAGSSTAQDTLYHVYWYGKGSKASNGVTNDYEQGLKWARAAAAQGNSDAEHGVALAYLFGFGVVKDQAEGLNWLKKAAEDGSSKAEYRLAQMYLNGIGVDKDETLGLRYLRTAADSGLGGAQAAMGRAFAVGRYGLPKDETTSLHWERLAADQRFESAQIALGMAYSDGDGVARDLVEAAMWEILATSTGCNRSHAPTSGLFPVKISQGDFDTARQLASEWDTAHPPIDVNQYDSDAPACAANLGSALPPKGAISGLDDAQDTSGKGAVLCIWHMYTETEATVAACGLPRKPIDDAIDAGISKMDKFITKYSVPPVTQDALDANKRETSNGLLNNYVRSTRHPDFCTSPEIEIFRKSTPDDFRNWLDDFLSVPRKPLWDPCLTAALGG